MINLELENLGEYIDPETGYGCDGGYGEQDTRTIHVDNRLSPRAMLQVILHEGIELDCKGRIRHTKIDNIARDLTEVIATLYQI